MSNPAPKELLQRYFAIGPFCWGSGDSMEAAIKNCKTQWYQGKPDDKKIKVYLFTSEDASALAEIYVGDMGIRWPKKVTRITLKRYVKEL